jgi:hypothetical protein
LIYDCRNGELQEIDNAQKAFEEFIRLHDQVKRVLAKDVGTHDPVHIWQGIWSGDYDCLIHQNSIAVAEMLKTPKLKLYHCFLVAGIMEEVLQLWKIGKELGRQRGAEKFQMIGRKGWNKMMGIHTESSLYTEEVV